MPTVWRLMTNRQTQDRDAIQHRPLLNFKDSSAPDGGLPRLMRRKPNLDVGKERHAYCSPRNARKNAAVCVGRSSVGK